jgi:hypothetical protein
VARRAAARGLFALVSGAGAMAGLAPDAPVPDAPRLLTWTFGALALAAGLGALALALSLALGDRRARREPEPETPPAAPLEAAVTAGLEDLRAEPDPRRAIARCYARFERAAAAAGLPRRPWFTPAEFMGEALDRRPEAGAAVTALTRLFELARFSQHALGRGDRDRAIEALDEIRAALDAGGDGAVAR